MTDWEKRLDRLNESVERGWGEPVLIDPWTTSAGGYATATVDPSRTSKEVVGVYTEIGAVDDLRGRARGRDSGMSQVTMARKELFLSRETLVGLGYDLAKGDRVTLVNRPSMATHEITKILPGSAGDVTLHLVESRGQ